MVDALDANLVAANIGATGSNVAADVNGDGVVNAADALLVRRQKGRRVTISVRERVVKRNRADFHEKKARPWFTKSVAGSELSSGICRESKENAV